MKNCPKNILVISFFSAPSAEVGAKRFCYLSGVLHEKGFNVELLSVPAHYYAHKDRSLNCAVTVHRVPMVPFIEPFPWKRRLPFFKKICAYFWGNYLSVFDVFSGWILPVLLKGFMLHKQKRLDAIIVTGPPFSPAISGYLLSRLTGSKLILDYRDPWTRTHEATRDYPKPFGRKINHILEGCVVNHAAALVFVSRIMQEDFKRFFNAGVQNKCHLINNGFFPANVCRPLRLESGKKVILYQGKFYGGKNIWTLLDALSELITAQEITPDAFRVHIFGEPLTEEDRNNIESHGLGGTVVEHPFVEYATLQQYMAGADILYLPSGVGVMYTIPGKFYEYLSVRRPILAVAPRHSEIEHMMKKNDCGEFAVIDSKESIKNALRVMLKQQKQYSFKGCEDYTWQQMGERYANLLSQILTS